MAACDSCPHETAIAKLQARDDAMAEGFQRIESAIVRQSGEIAKLATEIGAIRGLEKDHSYHRDALERAFGRIESLEESQKAVQSFMDKVDGMRTMAYVMWASMGAGILYVVGKLITMALNAPIK